MAIATFCTDPKTVDYVLDVLASFDPLPPLAAPADETTTIAPPVLPADAATPQPTASVDPMPAISEREKIARKRQKDAVRQAAYRAKKRDMSHVTSVTSRVTECDSVTPPLVLSPQSQRQESPFSEEITRTSTQEGLSDLGNARGDRHTERHAVTRDMSRLSVTGVSQVADLSRSSVPNVTDDGAFGMAVAAWCEGVSQVTGVPCTRPTFGELRALLSAIAAHRPPSDTDIVEWARSKAKAWVKAAAPSTVNALKFKDWLDGGEKPSQTRLRRVQPMPEGRPAWLPKEVKWGA